MANNKSAQKRIRINYRNRLRNKYYKTSVRNLIKFFFKTLEVNNNSEVVKIKKKSQIILTSIYSLLDKGTKKNVFHKNTAARKKAKLTEHFKIKFNEKNF